MVKASDFRCCVCGRQAAAFWPVIDPDIRSSPYCRQCLDKEKARLLMELYIKTDFKHNKNSKHNGN